MVDVFSVPVGEKILIYAPLHDLAALVNAQAASQIRTALEMGTYPAASKVHSIIEKLRAPGAPAPQARTGPLNNPLFLGLIPTRGCNLGCSYCGFAASKTSPVMTLGLARTAIDAYLKLLSAAGKNVGEIHFFGGEPFYASEVIDFSVGYATHRSEELGLRIRFEAITNGFFPARRARWIADHFDTIVLSLDGPADVQDRLRPAINGRATARVVIRTAHILSEGPAELILRACIAQETVGRMAEIAAWFVQEFRPSTVCFEALNPSILSQAAGLAPPDPVAFAVNFLQAAWVLDAYGVQAVNSTGDVQGPRVSCCPVGKDALIVSPDGSVDACYLLPEEWARRGLEMRLGHLNGRGFDFDPLVLQRVRSMTVDEKPLCADCLCRYSCAGGCHVNHPADAQPGNFDALCLQSRLIFIARLLQRLGDASLVQSWLADPQAMHRAARQEHDRLIDSGRML